MIAGSMVALVTPMDAQGGLDWDALSKLVDFHLQEGTNAIVAVGTTGESATLDVHEHVEVIRRVVDQVAGRRDLGAGDAPLEVTALVGRGGVKLKRLRGQVFEVRHGWVSAEASSVCQYTGRNVQLGGGRGVSARMRLRKSERAISRAPREAR